MMAVDEPTRHESHQRLDEVLGAEQAASLMAHLQPSGDERVVPQRVEPDPARLDQFVRVQLPDAHAAIARAVR